MSIWNKVLIGLILFASIGFFILGARALKTHQHWREEARKLQQELAAQRDLELVLIEGPDSPEVLAREQELEKIGGEAAQGIEQGKQALEAMQEEATLGLRRALLALHEVLVDRGRVWSGCRPKAQPETATAGTVVVGVEFPVPHQIEAQTVLWVFDEADVRQGGRYLGSFKVAGVGGQDVQLQPTVTLTPRQLAKLDQSAKRSGATWVLYEIMPSDNHQSLAVLSEDELKAMLPQETVDDYLVDGRLTTLEDVRQRGLRGSVFRVDGSGQVVRAADGLEVEVQAENEEGKYLRPLRDYEELFRHWHLQWTEMVDRYHTLTRNQKYLAAAQQEADLQTQYRQKEHDRLVAERTKYFGQRDTVAAHLKTVQEKLAAIQAAVAETIKTIQAMAGEIARIQREATQIIDQRTRSMAQAEAGS